MSTSSSNQTHHKILASEIMDELNQISSEFSAFQNKSGLACPSGCGKCCFKSDIYCTPIELLPLALNLLERGEAMTTYEKCKEHIEPRCIFMEIENRENGKGKCTEYNFRPLVCRIFGVAGRHDKNNKIIFSTCSTLKEIHPEKNENLNSQTFSNNEVPFIELAKSRLETLDPAFSEKEYPINVALAMMLEKVMMSASFSD